MKYKDSMQDGTHILIIISIAVMEALFYILVLPEDQRRELHSSPFFGICSQPKFIPLMYAPLIFEFESCNQSTDPIMHTNVGAFYNPANTSSTWSIEDVRVIADIVTLDSALQNSYVEHVLSGKALPINYSTFVTQYQTITSSDTAVNVTRAVSRLKSVFIDFASTHTHRVHQMEVVYIQQLIHLWVQCLLFLMQMGLEHI